VLGNMEGRQELFADSEKLLSSVTSAVIIVLN
jgi:hypothetical protein